MFRTTFLGHQGWMFRTNETTLLVDPLLEVSLPRREQANRTSPV